MKISSRNLYIDVMKGILIILVVIGHLPFFDYNSKTLTYIYSFHMPAFLIIAGILSHVNENYTYKGIISKKFDSILKPYFIFSLISLIISPAVSTNNYQSAVITMFKGIGDPIFSVNLPLWFLTFFFVAITLFEIIQCFSFKIINFLFRKKYEIVNKKHFYLEILTLLIITFVMFLSYQYSEIYHKQRLPFNFETACFCLGFLYIGKILGFLIPPIYTNIKNKFLNSKFAIIILIVIIVIFANIWHYFTLYNGRVDINARDYKNAFFMYFNALIGFFIFATFSFFISYIPIVKNMLSYIGLNSLYILAYHIPSATVTYNIILPLFPPQLTSFLQVNSPLSIIILTTFSVSISLLYGYIHKKIIS